MTGGISFSGNFWPETFAVYLNQVITSRTPSLNKVAGRAQSINLYFTIFGCFQIKFPTFHQIYFKALSIFETESVESQVPLIIC